MSRILRGNPTPLPPEVKRLEPLTCAPYLPFAGRSCPASLSQPHRAFHSLPVADATRGPGAPTLCRRRVSRPALGQPLTTHAQPLLPPAPGGLRLRSPGAKPAAPTQPGCLPPMAGLAGLCNPGPLWSAGLPSHAIPLHPPEESRQGIGKRLT